MQLSADEVFDDTDAVVTTTETSYTVTGLSAESGRHLRVRAVAGTVEAPVVSAWSSQVNGMSAARSLAVSFPESALSVAEGETTEIAVEYRTAWLEAPVNLRVSVLGNSGSGGL